MDKEKEIQELKERMIRVESQLQQASRGSNSLKFIIGFIVTLFLLLMLIGIVQFVSAAPIS